MPTLTSEELDLQPKRLLDDARQGTSDVVTVRGEPVMLTLPLGQSGGSSAERLELAVGAGANVLSFGRFQNADGFATALR